MTNRPYTDADLRAEAARLHARAASNTDDRIRPAVERKWSSLDAEVIDEACDELVSLLDKAADVSDWAVNLGADGLQPDGHHADFGEHPERPEPLMRLHFAFTPDIEAGDRHAWVQLAAGGVQDALDHALDATTQPITIPADVAAHILWHEGHGGHVSEFAYRLLDTWSHADDVNTGRLAAAFPDYAAALDLLREPDGVGRLQALAAGK